MRNALLATPRPVPSRRASTIAGAGVVVLALPVCLVGGFPFAGWALAAVLWFAGEILGTWLSRVPTGADDLRRSGFVAVGMTFRGIGVMIVLLAVSVSNRPVGITGAIVYALAYTLSLGVSLVEYFAGETRA